MSSPAPAKPSFLRRLWRWMRWVLLVLIVGLIALGVFHRTILLWALNRYAPEVAKSVPLALQWHVDGSLWSDLAITNLIASSDDEKMPLRSLKVGRFDLRHDSDAAWRGDYLHIAKGITLHDVEAVIDLRHPSPPVSAEPKPTDKQALIDMIKNIGWPDIELKNINVTLLMPDATLKVTGLDFNLPQGKPGELHIASVEHPALTQYPLREVSAKLVIDGAQVRIDEFKLPPQIEVEQLAVNAEEYGQGRVVTSTRIRSGAAIIDLAAKADLSGEHPLIDTTVDITGIDEKEIARWVKDMPPAQAKLQALHIVAKGDPMQPRQLNASVSLDVRDLAYQTYRSEGIALEAKLADGKLDLSKLSASAGGNRIEVTTRADAPAEWTGFAKTPLTLNWKLDAPTLQSILGLPIKLSGRISGDGTVKLTEQGLQSFDSHLIANDVAIDQHQLKSLDASAKGDLKAIIFDAKAEAAVGDGKLEAKGKLGLEAGTRSEAEWHVVVPKPEELTKSLRIAWPAGVSVGEVRTEGSAIFDLAKLKASDFDHAKAQGTLLVKQPSWKSAPCEQVNSTWKLEGGKATLSSLDVKLPGDNAIQLSANLTLANDQPFDAKLAVQAKDLAALRAWLDAAKVPQLQSGSVMLSWQGKGKLKDKLAIAGDASVAVEALRYGSLPDAASLTTIFSHDLEGANFHALKAKLGPWSASFTGQVSKTSVDLANIQVMHDAKKLIVGEVRVPIDLEAKPVPVKQSEPLHVRIDTNGRFALNELASLAKQPLPPDLAGFVSASVALDGTLPKLQSRIELKAEELKLPNVPSKELGKVDVLLTLNEGALNLSTIADVKPLEPLTTEVKAKVDVMALLNDPNLAMETPFEASVKLTQPSLDFLKPMVPMLDELRGSVLVDVKAEGTAKMPHVKGVIDVDVPTITPHDSDLPLVKDFKAQIVADDTMIQLKTLHALAAGGEINVSGTCELKDMQKPAFDVSLKAKDLLAVRNEMLSQRTDADLRIKGVPTAASVSGSIGLARGRVFQEVNFLPLNKMMNDLPPLPDEKASKPSKDPNASPLPPMLKDWTFDVTVKTKDDIRLLGNVLNGGVKIDLGIAGTGAAPKIAGAVTLEQARLNLPFSTLRVRKGVVSFTADKPLAPELELLAESTVDAYEINLRGYGAVTDPKLRFSSTPPLPEGEIATLLATGSTTSGLKKAGDDAAGRALLFVIREAYRRVFASKAKPKKEGEKDDESRFTVQERSENGALGGVTGVYELSRKMKVVGSTDKQGGFRAMFHYLFLFD